MIPKYVDMKRSNIAIIIYNSWMYITTQLQEITGYVVTFQQSDVTPARPRGVLISK